MSVPMFQTQLIVLANQPRLLREMLQRVLDKTPGLLVVAEEHRLDRLEEVFGQVQIDWLVVTLSSDGQLPHQVHVLLKQIPSLSLLAISSDGNHVKVGVTTETGLMHQCDLFGITLAKLLTILLGKPRNAWLFKRRDGQAPAPQTS
jgi:hypothetical protein